MSKAKGKLLLLVEAGNRMRADEVGPISLRNHLKVITPCYEYYSSR